MTRKPTTKSPDERRLRKHIRELLQVYAADTSRLNTDATVREFLNLIDDEVRRTRMSIAPVVQHVKLDGVTTVRRDMLPSTMTSRDMHISTGPRDDEVTGWYKDAAKWLSEPPYITRGGK